MSWQEIIGLVASCFVLLSFLFKNILVIRIINLVGAIMFVVYGLLINAWSVWILNLGLTCIQIYYIIRICLNKKKENKKNESSSDD